ncbi:MAG: hypothetical protein JXN61_16125 [Sedimentisphaerales bacterium]|nr:hypothetical protein [Sedimentisphaerales bacterium]
MQEQIDITKINHFLAEVGPIIVGITKAILHALGCKIEDEGHGLDLAFSIKSGEMTLKFYLRNLLLEIVTIDRDEEPLRFDEGLKDFEYFLAKMGRAINSKLRVVFEVLKEDDLDAAVENICKDAKDYERIQIWRFDQNKDSDSDHKADVKEPSGNS